MHDKQILLSQWNPNPGKDTILSKKGGMMIQTVLKHT